MSTYLYIYESSDRREVYIGIADSMRRVWEPHNENAQALRGRAGSRILQTVEPFSTREDARKAEAIAIYIAARAGQTVRHSDETDGRSGVIGIEVQDNGLSYTNRAGTKSTTVLGPAIYYRPGETVDYEDLTNTAIVRIAADSIDDRPSPFGGLGGAQFADRARKSWPLGAASREHRPVRRLLAVLKGEQTVLGHWRLAAPWFTEEERGWSFVLEDAGDDDVDGLKGRKLTFDEPYKFQLVGFSPDLRPDPAHD